MLTYSLIATAISNDRRTMRQSMRLLAEMAHKHGIPITWAIDSNAARTFAGDLTEWHKSHGDTPLPMVDIRPIWQTSADLDDPGQLAEHIVTMREKLPNYVSSEWRKIQRVMDWTTPTVLGTDWKSHVLLRALEQVGFIALWGYHWEGVDTELGDDRGCPFGFFYPSIDHHNLGGTPSSRMVAIPHASTDLLEARKQKSGAAKETPGLGLRRALETGSMQRTFNHYLASAKWNRWLAYIHHLDAGHLTNLTPEEIQQLDNYFANVCKQKETKVTLLADAVNDYQLTLKETSPTFLLMDDDHATEEEMISDAFSQSGLFYYDQECQFIFEKGKMEPIDMKNYVSPPTDSRNGIEYTLPQIENFRPTRSRDQLRMQFTVESTKAMPYAFAIWGNHEGLRLAKSNAKTVTWLGDQLLFVRVQLQPGNNDIDVLLTI